MRSLKSFRNLQLKTESFRGNLVGQPGGRAISIYHLVKCYLVPQMMMTSPKIVTSKMAMYLKSMRDDYFSIFHLLKSTFYR